ncbi:MAG: hypothetical protein DPW09_17825 [Anaerolineae bacterium]|nr:toprim domain-containing protein [Anaerolineales bacterium]MCQ3975305.1 hypothetical protein [Anaerolineae bacterium]
MNTGQKILAILESRPELQLKPEGEGKYRLHSPLRPGSNSHAFTLTINPSGEHGAYYDHAHEEDNGSLYDLAKRLGIEPSQNGNRPQQTTKRAYTGLADYAQAHGLSADVFKAAGWGETVTHLGRPALPYPTKSGKRYRFIDGNQPYYKPEKRGYKACWYGLDRAVKLVAESGQPLVICNGEASTIVAQFYGLAAVAVTGGEKPKLPPDLLAELQATYTGPVIVALDCDSAGRNNAPKLAAQLSEAGYKARAVDLALGHKGGDLADFCMLYTSEAAAKLQTLKDLAPAEATKDPEAKIKSADYLAALKALGYSFRLNVLNDSVEINESPNNDILAAEIRTRMRDIGFTKNLAAMEDAYTTAAAQNPYHPVKTYLESLKWDGLPYIDTLAIYFTDTQGVFGLWFKKWLVGAVAKIYEQAQNPMLVLDGAQGKGKSYFVEWLCPLKKYFMAGAIQPDNTDHKLLLVTKWIWEVSELGATTRKADREALKAFITLADITARKPYGKYPINKPAMASFIGTVNDEAGFLNDPTGSRRFLVCTLTKIDWDYTQLKVDGIWAEAYHLYRAGYNWRLTSEEQKLQAEINENYEVEEPLIEDIFRHFDLTKSNDDWVSTRDILLKVGLDPIHKGNTMRLSRTMKKLGITKGKQGPENARINVYFGLKKRVSELP